MKIFTEDTGSYESKVNFVDEQNSAVGYDLSQDCCEDADWFIIDKPLTLITLDLADTYRNRKPESMGGYLFDRDYICQVGDEDDGGAAIFRLTHPELKSMFLHLFNCHNGYYSHGFTYKFGNKEEEGYL